MALIERFVVLLYSRTSSQTTVKKARQELFSKGNRTLENIPPTRLFVNTRGGQYTRLGTFGGLHLLPSPSDWGWEKNGKKWKTSGNRCRHCYLKHNRYVTNSFTVAVKRDAQRFANVSERVWYARLSATAAGPASRIPN